MDEIREIIEGITEYYEHPIRVGSRCEANVFYRIEDLSEEDLEVIAEVIAERIVNVCSPYMPQALISMPGSYAGLARVLSRRLGDEPLEVVNVEQLTAGKERANWLKGMNVVLVNDVITTARTCIEAHTKATMLGASILCWAAIIDRTFGPGPVPVVAGITGEPVRLLEDVP
jgi:orotate phosphoribosyltransferase